MPSSWLRQLDSIVPDQYQMSHIKIALQNKIKLEKEDMKYLPLCITDITERGVEFALLLYISTPLLERSWSEPLWELCLWKLTEILNTGNKERISFWVERLLKNKKDLIDYLNSRYFQDGIDFNIESQYKLLFDKLFKKRPEIAFALNADDVLFVVTRRFLKSVHQLTKESIVNDELEDDLTRALLQRTFVVAKERVLQKIRGNCGIYKEELMMTVWHPDRIERILQQHGVDLNESM